MHKTMRKTADTLATVHIRHHYAATPARVFDAWLVPSLAGLWLFATASRPIRSAAIDARNGGAFCFVERRAGVSIEHRGAYLDVARPHRLRFELFSPDFAGVMTRVTVGFNPRGSTECELLLTHDGLPADCAAQVEARWTGMLYGLAVVLAHDDITESM